MRCLLATRNRLNGGCFLDTSDYSCWDRIRYHLGDDVSLCDHFRYDRIVYQLSK